MSYDFNHLGIELKSNRNSQKLICPNCIKIGKTNIKDTCLSVNVSEGMYNCFKCGWKGCVKPKDMNFVKTEFQQVYKLPERKNMTKLTDEALKYFESRGIPQSVVLSNKIASTKNGEGIIFPYLREGILINQKTRIIKEKKFYQAAEAEPIMFNLDRIYGQDNIIICEGEFDSMSWEVAGHITHTSVNQGAPNENDTNVDKKLECITNCFEAFSLAKTIYIAVDMDNNGIRLQKELIRRLGADKCKIVDFKDCKDANEFLLKHNAFELSQLLIDAKDVKIEGIFTLQDNFDSMMNGFRHGQKRGETTHCEYIDRAWKWRTGEVTVWTGYQNEGKSLMLNQLALIKSYWDGDKFAVFSPENMPIDDFYNDLIEMYIGKTSDPFYQSAQMDESEYLEGMAFVDKHFFVIYPDDDFSLKTIFDKALFLVRKQGIRHLIIDPYNTVEHLMKPGQREDLYISRFMKDLKRFSINNDISVHLVAHQVTARKNPNDDGRYYKPDLNNIKGGGTFADKADNGLFVWRPQRALDFRDTNVMFASQKIKKQKLVAKPCELEDIQFDFKSNRYMFNGITPLTKIDAHRKGLIMQEKEEIQLPKVLPNDAFGETMLNHNDEIQF